MEKKAIIFTTRHPFPSSGGDKVRLYNHLKYYHENNFKVDLVIIGFEKKICQKKYYHFDKIYYYKPSILNFILRIFKEKNLPLQIILYYQDGIKSKINRKFKDKKYDEALFHLVRTANYHECINANIKKLEMTDAISLSYLRGSKIGKIPSFLRFIYNYEKKKLFFQERKILEYFKFIYLISEFDKKFLTSGLKKKNNFIINLNERINITQRNAYSHESKNILFIGNFKSMSNRVAAIELINSIKKFNKIYNQDIKLTFCGNAGIVEKIFFKINKISTWISWKDLNEENKFFKIGICNNKIISGFQNKIYDYFDLKLNCLVYYKSIFSLPMEDKNKVIKFYTESDLFEKMQEIFKK